MFSNHTISCSTIRLDEYIEEMHTGALRIPSFQRSWVWKEKAIRSLLASISQSYPMGSILLLEAAGRNRQFAARHVEGVPAKNQKKTCNLILDGQQRLTAIYLALRSDRLDWPEEVDMRNGARSIYWLDIEKSLKYTDGDREKAVESTKVTDKLLKSLEAFNAGQGLYQIGQLSDIGYSKKWFPLHILFDDAQYQKWILGYKLYFEHNRRAIALFERFDRDILSHFRTYKLPTIFISGQAEPVAVCTMFERINDRGQKLTTFDLLTARFGTECNLREEWDDWEKKFKEDEILKEVRDIDFIQALTLLSRFKLNRSKGKAVSCDRGAILELDYSQYRKYAKSVGTGFFRAADFLRREGIRNSESIPYRTQLIPLAAIMAQFSGSERRRQSKKLVEWYWKAVFGERYAGPVETTAANDMRDIIPWIEGSKKVPLTIQEVHRDRISAERLLTRRAKQGAGFRGLMALLVRSGCRDFFTKRIIKDAPSVDKVDIHHIFPRQYCEVKGYGREYWDSVVNQTPISANTNTRISDKYPSKYMREMKSCIASSSEREKLLLGHGIECGPMDENNFRAFLISRTKRLEKLIEGVVGNALTKWEESEMLEFYSNVPE